MTATIVIDCTRCQATGTEILSRHPIEQATCGSCKGSGRLEVPAGVVVEFEITERDSPA